MIILHYEVFVKRFLHKNMNYVLLKALLKEHGYTQKTFSTAVGIPERTLDQWIYRNTTPDADTAVRMAQLLNTSVEYLVTGKEPASHLPDDLQAVINKYSTK